MNNIDQAIEKFNQFKIDIDAYIKDDLNESDTRSKLIDSLLINVLGWSEANIRREGKLESGYFDYHISVPGINFIIEAKRSFIEFKLPTNHKTSKIKSIYNDNKELFDQIRNYAIDNGTPYGILTNGKQFILCKLFNTDGSSWKDNQCLIFNGFTDIEKRFVDFYENLSMMTIVGNGGFKFDYPINLVTSNTIISTIIDREKELVRNSFSTALTPIIDRIFGEIFSEESENDVEFIQKCFVENQETKKNKDEIDKLFADKAPQLSNIVKAVNTKNIRKQINDEITSDNIQIKNLIPPKPIIIVGSKGAGKSTFINHLFISEDYTDQQHLPIYLDLRKFFNSGNSFETDSIAREILTTIYDKFFDLELHSIKVLKRIYLKEIKLNDESIWSYIKTNDNRSYEEKLSQFFIDAKSKQLEHLIALNTYLIKERRKRLIIIIDNADQYSGEIQENVFLFAHALSKKSFCGTIISLREGYFYKWRSSPPFDAYESNVYHITAPKYSEVLQRRIDYTLEKMSITGITKAYNENGFNIEIPNQAVIEFLSGLKNSLFSEMNSELIDYLNYTTYPNIREGLRVFKQFLISGHTNVSDYIVRERYRITNQNTQTIPIYEFIKAIGLNNKFYYNSETSLIQNILIPPVESDDHFLNLYILKDLNDILEVGGSANKYVSFKGLMDKFVSFGYRSNTFIDSISKLIDLNLLDSDEQISDTEWLGLPEAFNVAITSKGHYYYNELCKRFHYYDLVLQDTPIFDSVHFEKMKTDFPLSGKDGKRNLRDRIEVVKDFMEYLKSKDESQPNQIKTVFGSMSTYISTSINSEINRIEKKIP